MGSSIFRRHRQERVGEEAAESSYLPATVFPPVELNEILQWLSVAGTLAIGGGTLYLQREAIKLSREEVALLRRQVSLERKRSRGASPTEIRRLELDEKKLADRIAARQQRAVMKLAEWFIGRR